MIDPEIVRWFAAGSGMVAAAMVSFNLGRRITGYGFVLFTFSSVAWIAAGLMMGTPALSAQNGVLFVINVIGIYRWLIAKPSDERRERERADLDRRPPPPPPRLRRARLGALFGRDGTGGRMPRPRGR